MYKQKSENVESAYGSEISSNSSFLMKNDNFPMEESTSAYSNKSKSSNSWLSLKYKFRDYMVMEAVFFLILVFLLFICYRITIQNQETQRMILSIQSQLNSFQSRKKTGEDFLNMKEKIEKMIENGSEETTAMLEQILKKVITKSDVKLEEIQPIINSTTNPEETYVPPTIPTVSNNSTFKHFNAANLIAGSIIDVSLSSSSSLNPIFGFDQSALVLVDRPEPPANKAWCTSDKNPILTVNLPKYINPTAVSYQHSKWNGTTPDDAPKEYSVEACLDNYCMTRKPLFSHCQYGQRGLQEQICNKISNDSINSPVGKVQFRFHKNHGNTERTCVSLVRVYSKSELVKEQKLRRLEDTTTCIDLNHDYHNNPMIYKYFTFKNCTVLYSKGCCQECPECCEECEIKDFNPDVTSIIIFSVAFFSFFAFIILSVVCVWKFKDLNTVPSS